MIQLVLILTALVSLCMGLVIYLNSPSELKNRLYFGFSIASSIWLIGNAFSIVSSVIYDPSLSAKLFFAHLITPGSLVAIWLMYLYVAIFFAKPPAKWLVIGLSVVVALVSAFSFASRGVYIDAETNLIITGSFYNYYIVLVLVIVSLLFYVLFSNRNVKDAKDPQKQVQKRFITTGTLLAIIPIIFFGAIYPTIFGYSWLVDVSPSFFVIFVVMVAMAMTKFGWFSIRPVVGRSLSYILSLLLMSLALIAIIILPAKYLFFSNLSILNILGVTIITLLVVVLLQPLKKVFDRTSDKIFFRENYNPQELLNRINAQIVSGVSLYDLLNDIANTLKQDIKMTFCDFYIDANAVLDFHVAGTNTTLYAQADWRTLLDLIEADNQTQYVSEQVLSVEGVQPLMKSLGISIILKMKSKNQDVGYFVIGHKSSGEVFSSQDIKLLEIVADEIAISVQNNIQYEQIERFNETLQDNIKSATRELQHTNQKLRSLDDAKDEFISMASHQLRTPLTSIKGYISMILDGDAGEINDQQKLFLNQAFISSQRMVYLIADLLNVSRLKTGKFVIETSDVYLPSLVKTEVDQLLSTAEARGLKLVYDLPETFPPLRLDETKTRQVVMNFVDNAIYYTKKGGTIRILVKATAKTAQFTVTDDGIGVPKADQHKLFTKFYRAGNAKKARPDGTGLGLYMAKKVIVAQGGSIIFKTVEGKGSTFGFSFPIPHDQLDKQ